MKKIFLLFLSTMVFSMISGQNQSIPAPNLIGPITSSQGSIFCASVDDLTPFGYVEEEYFLVGKARQYDFENIPGKAVNSSKFYPYKTRIIVRRPVNVKKFNGTVALEWLNVSSMFDLDSDWWQLKKYLMRSGCIWVGVSVQQAGIHSESGLKKWNPERYGSLDVTVDSTCLFDQLSFDIFSQVAGVIKMRNLSQPLKDYKTNVVIATGHSQSANFLTTYYNFIQPAAEIIDGFLIRGAGEKLNMNVHAKAFKINAETDLIELNQINERQPDTDNIVTWEISGTSHADQTFLNDYSAICKRDFGTFDSYECGLPKCSQIPFYYSHAAAFDHLDKWIRKQVQPPSGVQMEFQELDPVVILKRDSYGNALGGIRLPQFDVPVVMNSGQNTGIRSCKFYGSHQHFSQEILKSLYPSHKDYIRKFKASVKKNLKAGYILKEDVPEMIVEAEELEYLWIEIIDSKIKFE